MSLDSTTRINDFFDSQVATPNNLYTIHLDKNEDLPDDLGGGVFVKLSTEASFDTRTGNSKPGSLYTETGIVIAEILAPVGLGNIDTYALQRVSTLIRDAFRGVFLNPVDDTEEGVIYFEDVSPARSFELPSKMGDNYLVKNVFINYQKNYIDASAVVIAPVNTVLPVVTGDTTEGSVLTTTNGTWDNSPTSYTYRWLRDDVAISGATASTYTLVAADLGTTIKSEVTAINAGGSTAAESVGTAIPSGAIQRNFTTLDRALTQYFALGSTVTLTGDFDVELDFTKLAAGIEQWLIGHAGADGFREIFDTWFFQLDSASSNMGSVTPQDDGKLHTLLIKRVSSTVECFMNGSSIGTATGKTGDFSVSQICAKGTGSGTWDGIISDVKITDAGTLIHQWNLDEDFGSTSTAVDSVGSNDATAVNIVSGDSENFTFNGAVSPNTWTNDGATRVIEVAGT